MPETEKEEEARKEAERGAGVVGRRAVCAQESEDGTSGSGEESEVRSLRPQCTSRFSLKPRYTGRFSLRPQYTSRLAGTLEGLK